MAPRSDSHELTAEQVCRRVELDQLPFATTAEVAPLDLIIGQPRALDAIAFGLETRAAGFNLYVAGNAGSGRESTVREAIERFAIERPTPSDWVYVHNFVDPDRPVAIAFPAGEGRAFAAAMRGLLDALQKEIPRAFESDDVQRRHDALVNEAGEQRSALLGELQKAATAREFDLQMTPTGIVSFPLKEGKPIPTEAFAVLPEAEQAEIERRGAELQEQIAVALRALRQIERTQADALQQLERDVVAFATGHLFETLRERYAEHAEVLAFLEQMESDIPAHLADFQTPAAAAGAPLDMQAVQRAERLERYTVNLLVDHSETKGAPVVFEWNATFANLVGRVDYRSTFGAMVTDFREIKPGALHRANGGFLVLRITDVLTNALAWETLKRALRCREITIENLADQLAAMPTARLRPEPIPLDLKVILLGSAEHYRLLYALDEDFPELFSVRADFAPDMDWSDGHIQHYAAFVSRQVREHQLRHFDQSAVARVIEYGARTLEDQRKLTTRFRDIANLIVEASHQAVKSGHDPVMGADVDAAIAKRIYRANLIEERLHELIADRTIAIDTEGAIVGQVNGLSVMDYGDYSFGQPSRITARAVAGSGKIQSIEREVELSGPIHSKGVLIISGYLQGQYGHDHPLVLSGTITFEQLYGEIEGDSASSAELYALLSALAELPIKQNIAVTGSVNQRGEVQAVGGVTRKIEGFFAVCQQRGLTGNQGVMVPASNVRNLMLNDEVVQAVRDRKFHIWQVRHVDEGIALLTGCEAGKKSADGTYPKGTVHRLVADRLAQLLDQARDASAPKVAVMNGRKRATKKAKPASA